MLNLFLLLQPVLLETIWSLLDHLWILISIIKNNVSKYSLNQALYIKQYLLCYVSNTWPPRSFSRLLLHALLIRGYFTPNSYEYSRQEIRKCDPSIIDIRDINNTAACRFITNDLWLTLMINTILIVINIFNNLRQKILKKPS